MISVSRRTLFFSAAALVVFTGAAALFRSIRAKSAPQSAPARTVTARPWNAVDHVTAVAELKPGRETEVDSAIPGIIKEIRVRAGDRVRAGTIVAVLDSEAPQARVRANEAALKNIGAELQKAEGERQQAEDNARTMRELWDKDLIARRESEEADLALQTAVAREDRARAELAQTEAARRQAAYLLRLTQIAAPIGGIIIRRLSEPGVAVTASSAIVVISDPAAVRVVLQLPNSQARRVAVGSRAALRADSQAGKVYDGDVVRITGAKENDSGLSTVEIRTAAVASLLEAGGVTVSLQLGGDGRELALVPRAALFHLDGSDYVYVLAAGQAQFRPVSVQPADSPDFVVVGNVKAGEELILRQTEKESPSAAAATTFPPAKKTGATDGARSS